MKIYEDVKLTGFCGFEFWSGAATNAAILTEAQLQELENILEELYPDGLGQTALNDIFWFEADWLAECLGFADWEELEAENAKEN